jgi:hypothetical protein
MYKAQDDQRASLLMRSTKPFPPSAPCPIAYPHQEWLPRLVANNTWRWGQGKRPAFSLPITALSLSVV